jgi:hypothetical protein
MDACIHRFPRSASHRLAHCIGNAISCKLGHEQCGICISDVRNRIKVVK